MELWKRERDRFPFVAPPNPKGKPVTLRDVARSSSPQAADPPRFGEPVGACEYSARPGSRRRGDNLEARWSCPGEPIWRARG